MGSSVQSAITLMRAGRRAEAIPELERAVAKGNGHAQYLLGVALYNGDDVVQDAARALKLLTAAAAAGVYQAQVALDDIAGSTGTADRSMLVSARCAEQTSAEFARLAPFFPDPAATLEAVARELLVPLLRERLEEMLPRAVRHAVDEALRTYPAQARPE